MNDGWTATSKYVFIPGSYSRAFYGPTPLAEMVKNMSDDQLKALKGGGTIGQGLRRNRRPWSTRANRLSSCHDGQGLGLGGPAKARTSPTSKN
jgi:hypothetical protein